MGTSGSSPLKPAPTPPTSQSHWEGLRAGGWGQYSRLHLALRMSGVITFVLWKRSSPWIKGKRMREQGLYSGQAWSLAVSRSDLPPAAGRTAKARRTHSAAASRSHRYAAHCRGRPPTQTTHPGAQVLGSAALPGWDQGSVRGADSGHRPGTGPGPSARSPGDVERCPRSCPLLGFFPHVGGEFARSPNGRNTPLLSTLTRGSITTLGCSGLPLPQ